MAIDWFEVNRALSPIKGYEDLTRRLRESFAYSFVHEAYNFTMPKLIDYTQRLLGGDARGRYVEYTALLTNTLTELDQAGVVNIQDLVAKIETRNKYEDFTGQSGVYARDIATVMNYLIYWLSPWRNTLVVSSR
jgi:hypothetical protein